MTGRIGVAISTTGYTHRLPLLAQSAQAWWRALAAHGLPTTIYVTVDGNEAAAQRAARAAFGFAEVYRVGQRSGVAPISGHLGVATNKNTGIELLMNAEPEVDHLFLCDDDTRPKFPQSLDKHIDLGIRHSMVCWGANRLGPGDHGAYVPWIWPRGVMLYAHRTVVETIGGMDERFGPGGHEHVEWSQRVHNAGLIPAPFVSPASYATREAMGAGALWHAEDMPRAGESRLAFAARKRRLTSVQTTREDWANIDKIMAAREGSQDFVAYQASENGRASATLCEYTPSRGAGEE